MTAVGLVAALIVSVYLTLGEYTKKSRVSGQLVPIDGVAKIHAREAAVVRERRVQEGQTVRKGDVLFVLAAERLNAVGDDVHSAVSTAITGRQISLDEEARARASARAQERASLALRFASAQQAAVQAESELTVQARRVSLSEAALARQKMLMRQGFISDAGVESKEAEVLAEQARLLALQRALHAARAEVATLTMAEREAADRHVAESASERRASAMLVQEADEHSAKREFAVLAPFDGQVTAIQIDVGQMAGTSVPLATVVPSGSELLAHLYVPSRAVGFIEPERAVLVRYDAYPYQKFGQYPASVDSVAKAALSPQEAAALGLAAGQDSLYRVTVRLSDQHVMAYGEAQRLQAGMRLEADILLDRRRLIEWVFEPLFSLSRRGA
jgi:membrane fusion protein